MTHSIDPGTPLFSTVTPGTVYGRYPYGLGFGDEQRFGPITIPGSFHANWWWDTELAASGEFLRGRILSAEFS